MSLPRSLLWVTPRSPLPAQDGARQATFHLVSSLAKLGVEIHLLAYVLPGEVIDKSEVRAAFGVKTVTIERREGPRHLRNLFSRPWMPLTFAPYSTLASGRSLLAAIAACGEDSLVVFDGLHAAGGWMALRKQARNFPFVVRAHNVEADLWKRGALKRRFPFSLVLSFQSRMVVRFERLVCRAARLVACVSAQDDSGLRALCGPISTAVIPIGIPMTKTENVGPFPVQKNLLFLGRLDWQPNRDGLRWFLEKIWPLASARSPDLSLTIAGAGESRWLDAYLKLPRLTFLGRVGDLAPLYQQAAASLVPIFFGSGTRVKAIEASSYARPCISTALGIEGIGLDESTDYFRGESEEEWLQILANFSLESAQLKGVSALEKVSQNYDPIRVAERFLAALN